MRTMLILLIVIISAIVLSTSLAYAHTAVAGWAYPYACCSGIDCREVEASAVSETMEGYRINATGEIIPYLDKKVKPSPDGKWHWCSQGGKPTTATICLFAPFGGS